MRPHHLLPLTLLLLGADDPWAEASTQDLHAYVRAVSLDLRGVVPSAEELAAIEAAGALDDATLQAWLDSPEFTEVVVEAHRERFWNALELRLLDDQRLTKVDEIRHLRDRTLLYRGGSRAHCGDFEAEVDDQNRPLSWQENSDGSISEGWVWIAPFWDPEDPIQVCAFDAQTALFSESGVDCSTQEAREDTGCGCGPELRWCFITGAEDRFEEAIGVDLDMRVREMLDNQAPYSGLFDSEFLYVNGPSAHFWKHIASFDDETYTPPARPEDIPDLDYFDESFTPVPLAEPQAGVLTAPGWLLRHQTNRGRANRFYGGFLCDEFLPVAGGIDLLSSAELPTPDLQSRAGCLDCHSRLEPWAAYWGRWSQAGARYMAEDDFPAWREDCASCARSGSGCTDTCEDHYIVEASHPDDLPFLGSLQAYAYHWGASSEHPDLGPGAWAAAAIADGSLAACAVQQTAGWLLQTEAPAQESEEWTAAFAQDEDYRKLVERVVTSSAYWGGAR